MKAIQGFIALALVLALGGGTLSSARAGDDWGGYAWGPSWYPFSYFDYRLGNIPAPPYFAIHPPVYYGTRVGMPYGNSPYARPPRPVVRVLPRLQKPKPVEGLMIENPFVKDKGRKKARRWKKSASSKPKTIINPYVVRHAPKETDQLAAD